MENNTRKTPRIPNMEGIKRLANLAVSDARVPVVRCQRAAIYTFNWQSYILSANDRRVDEGKAAR